MSCAVTSGPRSRTSIKSLRALHVLAVPGGEATGPAYTVPRLCKSLKILGTHTVLLGVGPLQDVSDGRFRHICFPQTWGSVPILRTLRYSRKLSQELQKLVSVTDVVHTHGLWLLPNIEAGWLANRAERPLIVAPRGMLAPAALEFSRIKKQVFWHAFQRNVIEGAACLHATSEQEYLDIRAIGLRNPIALVKNGIDLPKIDTRLLCPNKMRTVLYLGRIHPIKGLDLLIRSWARLERSHPNWQLRIIGPSERGYVDKLRALVSLEGLHQVSFEGPVFGAEKIAAYRSADLYVLPTRNENFAMTVAEALAAEVPVIASKGAPWAGLLSERCGWWIDHGVAPLTIALSQAMNTPLDELRAMGVRGRSWMARDFGWESIGMKTLQVYEWLVDGAVPPPFVEFG